MQLICMICSSFKEVFKSSISELRSESGSANPQTGSTNPANTARPDLDPVFESLEDDFDDKRKNPESLKEVKSDYLFVCPSVRLFL